MCEGLSQNKQFVHGKEGACLCVCGLFFFSMELHGTKVSSVLCILVFSLNLKTRKYRNTL